jgi:hypothetical protein
VYQKGRLNQANRVVYSADDTKKGVYGKVEPQDAAILILAQALAQYTSLANIV